jgi:Family of unknown function (DUF5683)
MIILVLLLFCAQQNSNAQDSIPLPKPPKPKFQPEPYKATMKAVVFPGMGQIYNRKYWKVPFVYAGFGALIYTASYNTSKYTEYMIAYQDFTDDIPQTKTYLNLIPGAVDDPDGDPVDNYTPAEAAHWEDQLLQGVDYYKRYRDLSYIGLAGWYLITILDANVDASLFNYDVSDNLDITLFPSAISLPGGFIGAGINVGMRVNF